MRLELIRHGETVLQKEHRYQGVTDVPLSPPGRDVLHPAGVLPERVVVTPLRRTRETAELLFPGVPQLVIPGLQEMNFGRFEGKNYLEMENDPDYRTWVDGMCLERCPGGESKAEYVRRVTRAFAALLDQALEQRWKDCVIVAHGGTQMAVLERFAVEKKDYYSWQLPCGHGYRLDAARWQTERKLEVLGQTDYTGGNNMKIVYGAILSFLLDLLLGDPMWMPHPVVLMGKCITRLEKRLRRTLPDTEQGLLWGGRIMAFCLPVGTLLVSGGAIWLLGKIHPVLSFLLGVFWGWQALAMRDLKKESKNVYRKLTEDTLENARLAVSRIVGRDTQSLSVEGVTKAAVETVAENFSDGVVAPMLYLLVGGAPLALCYKAVNTMDSMVGYKNEKYLYFGRAAAKLDDAANYLPSRLSALLLIAASFFCRENVKNAWKIWRRDRRNHASPNSAQTEAVMAGALMVQLAGPAWYFGQYYDKPTIGDPLRPVEPGDILRANRMLYWGGFLSLILLCGIRALICILL